MAQLTETAQLAFTTTGDTYATFGLDIQTGGSGVQQVYLYTSADVYIEFDQATAATRSFLLSSGNSNVTNFEIHGGSVTTVHARGKTGSGTLYIMGIRN